MINRLMREKKLLEAQLRDANNLADQWAQRNIALEAENARLVERTGYLVEFVQQMARQQGEPYYQKLAKAALKKWSGL